MDELIERAIQQIEKYLDRQGDLYQLHTAIHLLEMVKRQIEQQKIDDYRLERQKQW